jgi:2-polyprenyl-3-methyl-5-hydroxy-6-metoxy-1,4-benzoquinol methylase
VSLRRKKIDVDVRGRRLFSKWQKKSTQFSPSLEIVSTVTTYFSRIVAPPKHTPPRDMPPEVRQRGGRPKKTQRPEDATTGADANAYYDKMQTATYTKINVVTQREITSLALDLLQLGALGGGGGGGGGGVRNGEYLLADVGCGSGLSGEEISRRGHTWVGADASFAMLQQAVGGAQDDITCTSIPSPAAGAGAVALVDFAQGLPFRAATFDG